MNTLKMAAVLTAMLACSCGDGGGSSSGGGSSDALCTSCKAAVSVQVDTGLSLTANTVLLMHFENNLVDESGRHTATDSGTVDDSVRYKYGAHSRKFSGAQYVTFLNGTDWDVANGDFEISFSMRTVATTPMYFFGQYAASCSNTTNTVSMDINGAVGGQVRFQINEGGTNYALTSNGGFNDGNWHSVKVARTTGTIRLYVDGIQYQQRVSTAASSLSLNNFTIGRPGDCNAQYFNGNIDEFRMTKN